MYIFFYFILAFLFLYSVLIGYYDRSWKTLREFDGDMPQRARMKISVIIPARNEAEHIIACLRSIQLQTYDASRFEVIVIDDHSTDSTARLVEEFPMPNLKLIRLSEHMQGKVINAYKKKAIETGIAQATGELIVTTDADCTVLPGWLSTIAIFQLEKDAAFIAAPVKIEPGRSLLSIFQSLDFLTLQGITAASVHNRFHNMCNGANLAYLKSVFYDVGGFSGIDKIASGDDMLLMQKVAAKYPDSIFFLKSIAAIVTTEPAISWKAFLHQRVRWASKSGNYKDAKITTVLLLVYLLNVSLLVCLVAGFFEPRWLLFFLLFVVLKTIIEMNFTKSVARFFNLSPLMKFFALLQPLHIVYIVIAGWLGMFGRYQWKERKVK